MGCCRSRRRLRLLDAHIARGTSSRSSPRPRTSATATPSAAINNAGSVPTSASATSSAASAVEEDLAFASQLDGTEQRFVVIWPAGLDRSSSQPHDVLIALHGHGSDRRQFVDNVRGECLGARDVAARHGMVYVSPDYRAPTSWMGPEAEADMVQLIQLLREGLVPCVRHIVLCGASMGATGAVVFATLHPSLLDGVVSLNGMADMESYANFAEAIESSYGALDAGAVLEERRRRSAVLHPERLFGLPLASTTGGLDESVPPASVLELLDALTEQQGKHHPAVKPPVLSIHRPNVGHETDYADTVAALEFTLASLREQRTVIRSSFRNSLQRFESQQQQQQQQPARVAFMGGSITEMDGYRPMVATWLQERFPATPFDFVAAGISSTCSTTGAFRLEADVLQSTGGSFDSGPGLDLFFVEFAVNDDQDAMHSHHECVKGMEGIIRHARAAQPELDIVVVYFVNESMLSQLQAGEVPTSIAAHEAVCSHYGVSSVLLAQEVARQISTGELSWEEYGGVHPAPHGNAIAAGLCQELLDTAWRRESKDFSLASAGEESEAAGCERIQHRMPPRQLDDGSYVRGRWISPEPAATLNPDQPSTSDDSGSSGADGSGGAGWTWEPPRWTYIEGGFRETFSGLPLLCGSTPGAETAPITFEGEAFGVYVLAGPDAGVVEVSIDGGSFDAHGAVDLYHRFSAGLHYPRTVMLAEGLAPGRHEVRLRLRQREGTEAGGGNTARVLQFAVN